MQTLALLAQEKSLCQPLTFFLRCTEAYLSCNMGLEVHHHFMKVAAFGEVDLQSPWEALPSLPRTTACQESPVQSSASSRDSHSCVAEQDIGITASRPWYLETLADP